jgi:alkylation response protein AidB-like acyl-CoA dehydrogenase
MEGHFQLAKKQLFFRDLIRDLTQKKIAPLSVEGETTGEFPLKLFALLGQNRLLGLLLPKEIKGEGAGFLDFCVTLEEISKVSPLAANLCLFQNLGARLIQKFGNEEQKKSLAPLVAGQIPFGFALNETESLDLSAVPVDAKQEGDSYILNGSRCYAANGDVAGAKLIFARNHQAIEAFLLDENITGIHVSREEGLKGSEARYGITFRFQACRVPVQKRLGKEGEGLKIMEEFLAELSCAGAARAVGLAQGALEYSLAYAKSRVQFGSPILRFQAIQSLLANMATKVEAARQLVYVTASMVEMKDKKAGLFASMAKNNASDTAMAVTTDAVQIAGGYGYMRDYPLEKMMRNAKLAQITEGTNQIHQLLIVQKLANLA